jgi:hypothetical protein
VDAGCLPSIIGALGKGPTTNSVERLKPTGCGMLCQPRSGRPRTVGSPETGVGSQRTAIGNSESRIERPSTAVCKENFDDLAGDGQNPVRLRVVAPAIAFAQIRTWDECTLYTSLCEPTLWHCQGVPSAPIDFRWSRTTALIPNPWSPRRRGGLGRPASSSPPRFCFGGLMNESTFQLVQRTLKSFSRLSLLRSKSSLRCPEHGVQRITDAFSNREVLLACGCRRQSSLRNDSEVVAFDAESRERQRRRRVNVGRNAGNQWVRVFEEDIV